MFCSLPKWLCVKDFHFRYSGCKNISLHCNLSVPLALAVPTPEDMHHHPIDPHCPYHKYTCASKCDTLKDGDYRSCLGCDVYATCSNGILYDNRPCPAGLVWSTDARACTYKSNCSEYAQLSCYKLILLAKHVGRFSYIELQLKLSIMRRTLPPVYACYT